MRESKNREGHEFGEAAEKVLVPAKATLSGLKPR
jgi:hypothetical protein